MVPTLSVGTTKGVSDGRGGRVSVTTGLGVVSKLIIGVSVGSDVNGLGEGNVGVGVAVRLIVLLAIIKRIGAIMAEINKPIKMPV